MAQDPVKIEQWNDFGAIRPLIETPVQALELALWVADGFDITGVVRHEHSFAERGVYGRGMGKVVGLDHVGEKMHRRAASLGGQKHGVEGNTIATKNLAEEGAARCFGIIEQEQEVTGSLRRKRLAGRPISCSSLVGMLCPLPTILNCLAGEVIGLRWPT